MNKDNVTVVSNTDDSLPKVKNNFTNPKYYSKFISNSFNKLKSSSTNLLKWRSRSVFEQGESFRFIKNEIE